MGYPPQRWADDDPTTPVNASRLTHIESGIQSAASVAAAAAETATLASSTANSASATATATSSAVTTKAPLASPAFTGTPTAPTPTAGDSSTKLATTAYTTGQYERVIVVQGAGIDRTGGTDSTAAIQAFLATAAANAAGGVATGPVVVYFPEGQYKISAALTIDSDRVQVVGSGRNSCVILTTSATADVFTLGNGTTARSYNHFRGFTVSTSATKTAGCAFNLNNVTRAVFEDINLVNQFIGYGLYNGSGSVWINRGNWGGTVATTGVGVDIQGGNDHYLSHIVMDKPSGTQPLCAVRVGATAGTWISDCDFIHCGDGILINPGTGQIAEFLFINNTAFDYGTGHGIHINPSSTGKAYNLQFTACWTSSFTGNGVYTDASGGGTIDGVKLIGHRSEENGGHGFSHEAGSNVSVLDSDFGGNSEVSHGGVVGVKHGVNVAANISNWSVLSCRLKPTGSDNNNQGYGLMVAAGTSDHYRVIGNDMTGNVTGGMSNGGTGTNKIIRLNDGYQPPWPAFTPTLGGAGWALGNGSISGFYEQVEKTVRFQIKITFGSTSTFGTANMNLSLPVTSIASTAPNDTFLAHLNNSGARSALVARRGSTTVLAVDVIGANGAEADLTGTSTPAVASGSVVSINGQYQAA